MNLTLLRMACIWQGLTYRVKMAVAQGWNYWLPDFYYLVSLPVDVPVLDKKGRV